MDKVTVRGLLGELPKHDRQDRFIHKILLGLLDEGHTELERVVVPSWEPVLLPGESKGLYLILSGNASIAFPKDAAHDLDSFTPYLVDIATRPNPVTDLTTKAESHPLV